VAAKLEEIVEISQSERGQTLDENIKCFCPKMRAKRDEVLVSIERHGNLKGLQEVQDTSRSRKAARRTTIPNSLVTATHVSITDALVARQTCRPTPPSSPSHPWSASPAPPRCAGGRASPARSLPNPPRWCGGRRSPTSRSSRRAYSRARATAP